MRRWIWISLFTMTACASGPSVLSMNAFYDISVGATRDEVVSQAGNPYSIKKKQDGSEEFVYIERLKAGARLLQERRYIITIKDGVVVSKRVETAAPSPTLFDSYEMQTTQSE